MLAMGLPNWRVQVDHARTFILYHISERYVYMRNEHLQKLKFCSRNSGKVCVRDVD